MAIESADSQLGPEDDGEQSEDDGRCQTEVQVEEQRGDPCDQPHRLERGHKEPMERSQPDSWDSLTDCLMIKGSTHQVDLVAPPQLRDIRVLLEHPLQIDKDDRRQYSLKGTKLYLCCACAQHCNTGA